MTGDCAHSIPDALKDLNALGITPSSESLNLIGTGAFDGNGPFPGLFPVNQGINSNSPIQLNSGFPNINRSDTGVVKLDQHFNESHFITAHYLIGDSTQTEQDSAVLQPQWRSQSQLRAQLFGINWTWTPRGHWVNEARFGLNNFWQTILAVDHNEDPLRDYGINTGVTNLIDGGLPEIDISGFTSLGNISGWPLETTPNRTFQFADTMSYTRGKHNLHFGGELRRGSSDNIRNRTGKGRIEFTGGSTPGFPVGTSSTALEDFLAGFPSTGKIFVGNSERNISMWSFAGFIQDYWRATPRLTINAGLRYELNTVIREAHNLLGNFDPNVGLEEVGVNISSPYDGDHDNFAPRLGLAWDASGHGKTIFRAGASINYEIPNLSLFIGQNGVDNATTPGLNDIPTGAIGSRINGNIIATGLTVFPCSGGVTTNCLNYTSASSSAPIFSGLSAILNCDPNLGGSPCDILGVNRHLRTPYVASWNVNIQQALTNDLSLQVAYVGNRGLDLYSVRDINQSNPSSPAAQACFLASSNPPSATPQPFNTHCEQQGRPFNSQFPFLEFINFLENLDSSNYQSLQVTATQRVSRGLNFLAGYTWSHSIDDATGNRPVQPQDSNRLERASSDFDIRNRLTLALTYEFPSKKSFWQLFEGWQMNHIVTIQGGTPWTMRDGALIGDDISVTGEFADRWNIFGSPANIQVSPSGIPFFAPATFSSGSGNPDCMVRASLSQLQTYGCFEESGTVIVPQNLGTFGNMPRNAFRGRGSTTGISLS